MGTLLLFLCGGAKEKKSHFMFSALRQTQLLVSSFRCVHSRILTLEGNIGAGKSTLLNILDRRLDAEVIQEPVDKWRAVGGDQNVNLLEVFYKDPKRWGYTFQSFAFYSRLQMWTEHPRTDKPHRVYERSVFSDMHVFAKNTYATGLMNDTEWAVYMEWYRWLVGKFGGRVDGIIYMKTSPEVCMQRLKKRNRTEEAGVPLEYLQQIHDRHEQWLCSSDGTAVAGKNESVPVLTLPCDVDFENDPSLQDRFTVAISKWMDGLPVA